MTENTPSEKKNGHWKIQYARYFNFPKSRSSSSSLLRPIVPTKQRPSKGKWLPSFSSNVSLQIICNAHSISESTLIVSLDESIVEEHYITKLYFTWPHGSEISGCALKASRVIFASYRDGMGQIQKFALRFSSSAEPQKFMELLESLKEGRSSSGISHCEITWRNDEEHNVLWQQPSTNQEHGSYSCSEQAAQGPAVGGTDVAMPQSYTSLLSDSCVETDLGIPQEPTDVDLRHFIKAKWVADNFIGLMDKLDTIIVGLGGDLAI